ncbi:MAG: helicase [Planctomycetes bacterium]|nr:helicase [Planctomycetota bacterium]
MVDAGAPSLTPSHVRVRLLRALELDLVGPSKGSDLEEEVLPQAPSRWYLTGFLAPTGAGVEQRGEETSQEEVSELREAGGTDDAGPPEPASARRAFFPSSIGLSFLVPRDLRKLQATARWGDYRQVQVPKEGSAGKEGGGGPHETESRGPWVWKRVQRQSMVELELPEAATTPHEIEVPGSGGLRLVLSVRPVNDAHGAAAGVPAGTRSVSLFLVNVRRPAPDEVRDEAFVFQAELEVASDAPLVPRPNLRGLDSDDWDERVADLQYRDAFEFAVGHGVATQAFPEGGGACRRVATTWIPAAEVERVAPAPIDGVELGMEELARLPDAAAARERLGGLVRRYREWLEGQRGKVPASPGKRRETAEELLRRARAAAGRIEAGIALLEDTRVLEAFRIANRAMGRAARQRAAIQQGKAPAEVGPPEWRPFQLAFILMNLPGIVDPFHADRELVDLLFFPTGGGKTEAYLGLAAFTLVHRRLTHAGIASAGLSVLMRYTLRLLTLDQLSRAAALICALELEREEDPQTLGEWPFEIGLWVGLAATPNKMGAKGDPDSNCAYRKTIAFKNDDRKPAPIPIEECPWCGTKFKRDSFHLVPSPDQPQDLRVTCVNRSCAFTRDRPLPILGVDEPIYRRLPCFLIATVDKFAAMPWTGQVGAFFGRVDRHDKDGFYGPCDPGRGRPLPASLPPPDLVVQDELHLISGPLGTIAGLYECALDELCARTIDRKKVRPKIVASTATVRRAESQIRALFNRPLVEVFPPPGPDRRDSFFARVEPPHVSNVRLYVGIAAQGRSQKVVLLRSYLVLLGATQRAWGEAGGKRAKDNSADPYMTLLGYFNSLRELGGSRRIVEDEVRTRLSAYSTRRRGGKDQGLFSDRDIQYDVVELTSRVSTDKVAEAKRRLGLPFHDEDRVDVALATNMISVGLDILRLGLMVVLGQPKTSAEYIQATSRVGRDPQRPGLVVALLNIHKPRDRSHYERFAAYHETFYRTVEATSVTPFSPRALDRALAATLVALARQGHAPMTPPLGAQEILSERGRLEFVLRCLEERAATHAQLSREEAEALRQRVRDLAKDLFDAWSAIAHEYGRQGVLLQYQTEAGGAQRLLYDFLSPELKTLPARHKKFRANRSMRDVEPAVNLWVRTLDGIEVEDEEDTP